MPYTIEHHKHRLAAWAASRAASVKGGRFKVQKGAALLQLSGFDAEFSLNDLPAPTQIDDVHKEWRKSVIQNAEEQGLIFSHGVAAKIINCYLKVRFVCGGCHADERVKALHPPIDDLLLKELAERNFGGEAKQWRRFRQGRWSKFDSETYEGVVALIRRTLPADEPLWRIEEHWEGYQ